MINIQTAKNYYKPKNRTFVKKLFLICFLFSFCLNLLLGQENLSQGKILITERADYSVYIDGKYAGLRWYGDKVFDISKFVRKGENTIQVKVTTLMDNYMQTLKDNKVAQRFVIKRNHKPKPMGIIGDVKIYR